MTESIYPLPAVLIALELTEPVVTNWAKRGMTGLVIDPSGRGRGRARELGWEAVQRLALIKALTDAGIPVARAAYLADHCLVAMRTRPRTETMEIYTAPGDSLIAFNGEPVKAKMFTPPWTTVTLHVKHVLDLTKQSLGPPSKPIEDEPASTKRPRSRKVSPPKG